MDDCVNSPRRNGALEAGAPVAEVWVEQNILKIVVDYLTLFARFARP
jgi:hypothetical protein